MGHGHDAWIFVSLCDRLAWAEKHTAARSSGPLMAGGMASGRLSRINRKHPWELHMRFNCRVKQPLTQPCPGATIHEEELPFYRTMMQRRRSVLDDGDARYWWAGWDQTGRLCTLVFQQASAWFRSGATYWSASCQEICDLFGDTTVEGQVGIWI